MVKEIRNVVMWLKNWFYEKSEVYSKNETYTKAEVDTALGNKLNSNLTTANKMLVTDTNGNVTLDDLPHFEGAIEVVETLPTPSNSTMGKLYIINENTQVNVYYTQNNNGTYSWHEMDTDILDDLSIDWSEIKNNPFDSSTPSSFANASHNHDANQITYLGTTLDIELGLMFSDIDDKAPANHSSSKTTYGVGTTSYYGHNKVIDNLTSSTLVNGESLSAHQGYVLKGLIDGLEDELVNFDATTVAYEPDETIWGEYVQVIQNVATALTVLKEILNTKPDSGDCVTSIELIPKSEDATGAIRLYYGDE